MDFRITFHGFEEFRKYLTVEGQALRRYGPKIVDHVRRHGLIEPISGVVHSSADIVIDEPRRHTSIWAGTFNCRMRAGMVALEHAIAILPPQWRQKPKILGTEGITDLAGLLRGHFPYYLGGEYLPTETEQENHYPVPHIDLTDIDESSDRFDIVLSSHVLEHVASLDGALSESFRVLRGGGMCVATFPFDPDLAKCRQRAMVEANGEVKHLLEPVYHANPVAKGEGSLVFNDIGWDVLDHCHNAGFSESVMLSIASSRHGVVGVREVGSFVLVARKPREGEADGTRLIPQRRSFEFADGS